MDLEVKDDVEGFLGIDVQQNPYGKIVIIARHGLT
jgi:hypothetical protein